MSELQKVLSGILVSFIPKRVRISFSKLGSCKLYIQEVTEAEFTLKTKHCSTAASNCRSQLDRESHLPHRLKISSKEAAHSANFIFLQWFLRCAFFPWSVSFVIKIWHRRQTSHLFKIRPKFVFIGFLATDVTIAMLTESPTLKKC